jgi:hypothetical protein
MNTKMMMMIVMLVACFCFATFSGCDEDADDICDDCDTSAEREICEEAVDECNRLDTEAARDECVDEIRNCNIL